MSSVSNALNMALMLQVKGEMTIRELAARLEVSEKMVKRYKTDLEMAGIYVGSTRGRNGGYFLETNIRLDAIDLTLPEIKSLQMALETVRSGNFHYSKAFESLANKIFWQHELDERIEYRHKMMRESHLATSDEKYVWHTISGAIMDRSKIQIVYRSLKAHGVVTSQRIVHPYGVFDYQGATYTYGFCEKADALRIFKLSRIDQIEVLSERFEILQAQSLEDILESSFGIYNDALCDVKVKIHYPMSEIVKEKIISKNQKITAIDNKTILFEARMRGYEEYKSWVLSMGTCAEVITPEKLKEDIKAEILAMKKIYNL
jgi:predicted DNA-binding transcriptional regulator YafY